MIAIHRHDTSEETARALADRVASRLAERLAERDRATIAVSGGRTPLPFFRALRDRDLDWKRVVVTLADERWVAADHPESNEGLVRRELLTGPAAEAAFVGLRDPEATTVDDAAERASARVDALLPLDLAVLGMGEDGHTASLIPGARGLERGLDLGSRSWCVAIDPPGGRLRLSMTASALLTARALFLHWAGEAKRRVFEEARRPGPVEELPIRFPLQWASSPVEVYWSP